MIKQLFTKIKTQQKPIGLGRGIYVQSKLYAHTIHFLPAQKTYRINQWATNKCYKTT
jgi:hypothetical protein